MNSVTKNVSDYIKEKGINLSKMSRDTKISYAALYNSLLNDESGRDLRAGEFLDVCMFLGVDPMAFAQTQDMH